MNDFISFFGNHWVLTSIFCTAFVVLIIFEAYVQTGATKNLSPQMLVQAVNHDEAIVVDVRESNIYKKGHIINSLNIPLSELDKRMSRLNAHKNKIIVVVCGEGQSPAPAVTRLTKYGFQRVQVLAGGIKSWCGEGLPLSGD